ncbi:hypothetical protein OROGR_025576 [Orobanche gracilis]
MVEASRDSSTGEPRRRGAICFWSDPDPKTLAAAAGAEDGDGSIQSWSLRIPAGFTIPTAGRSPLEAVRRQLTVR